MTFFFLVPLGLLLAFLGRAAITVFSILAILLVIFVLGLLGDQTGHPGLFWMCLIVGSIGVVVAYKQHAKWRVRQFINFAETKLTLTQDPTGWELYDRAQPSRRILGGYVPDDKVWLCRQAPQSAEAQRLMTPPASCWAWAVRVVERDKYIKVLRASVSHEDWPVFMASQEFKRKVAAVEAPYIEVTSRFRAQEETAAWVALRRR